MSAAKKLTEEQIVGKLDELPTLPAIIYELGQVINDPMSSTKDIENIMSNDLSLTTKVLKLANSAYYAIPGGERSLSRAISYLGFDTVNQLVLSSSILEALDLKEDTPFDMTEFWKHCIGVGFAAETIAKHINHPMPSDLFTCGLVHDMGKIAFFTIDPESMNSIIQYSSDKSISYIKAEEELEFPKHTIVGGLLASRWQLPLSMQASIKFHHENSPQKRY